ncbi:MAG: radical SAM protein [bacterium]|nr:radical SAM protein [bacterium]
MTYLIDNYIPKYTKLFRSSKLKEKKEVLNKILESCILCPRQCKVNRKKGEIGYCKSGNLAKVSSFNPHFGEEDCLVGRGGSGTIFFTNCNLGCVFCQNYDISHLGKGSEVSYEELASYMLSLQELGCININLVTPTHFIPQIVEALIIATHKGLNLPLVYNSSGYENVQILKILEGIIDIYMPDAKYFHQEISKKYSNAKDYPEVMKNSLKEMHRQTGDLIFNDCGEAQRGLLIRHLVLPHNLAGTKELVSFIVNEVSPNTYINVMAQYRPMFKASQYELINRLITIEEFEKAKNYALDKALILV